MLEINFYVLYRQPYAYLNTRLIGGVQTTVTKSSRGLDTNLRITSHKNDGTVFATYIYTTKQKYP